MRDYLYRSIMKVITNSYCLMTVAQNSLQTATSKPNFPRCCFKLSLLKPWNYNVRAPFCVVNHDFSNYNYTFKLHRTLRSLDVAREISRLHTNVVLCVVTWSINHETKDWSWISRYLPHIKLLFKRDRPIFKRSHSNKDHTRKKKQLI